MSKATIEIAAFPEPEELKKILVKYKKGTFTLEQAMYAIERLEEANIRFQNLALSQAQFQIMNEAKDEQHEDLVGILFALRMAAGLLNSEPKGIHHV